jgi:superfamily II DNA/RNA helicase
MSASLPTSASATPDLDLDDVVSVDIVATLSDPLGTPSFRDLGLPSDLADHLTSIGITAPSPIQSATMADLLAGLDVLAAAPTGSGKTLAFSAPLMARLGKGQPNRPAALVLSPTRELAAQIHTVLADLGRVRGRYSASVYGGVKQGPQVNNLRRGVDVLVACPGRLEDLISQGHVKLDRVQIVVIDEADRMADMGFLPCVRRILDQTSPARQTMLFSATLDGAADSLARTHLKHPAKHQVAEADAGAMTHLFWATPSEGRVALAADIVRRGGRTMLFTRTKHGADRLGEKLQNLGIGAAVIHGGRSQQQRDRSLEDFHRGKVTALVATDVAARGIHVQDVACVVHVDLPDNPTDYQHRSGRTARAGATGTVISLVTNEQRRHAKSVQRAFGFADGMTKPDLDAIEATFVAATGAKPRATHAGHTSMPDSAYPEAPIGGRDSRGPREGRPAREFRGDRDSRPARDSRDGRPSFRGDRDARPAAPRGDRDARPSAGFRDDRPARDSRPGGPGAVVAKPRRAPHAGGAPAARSSFSQRSGRG